jgi:membrane protein implicated in regulation of membrane protease activity
VKVVLCVVSGLLLLLLAIIGYLIWLGITTGRLQVDYYFRPLPMSAYAALAGVVISVLFIIAWRSKRNGRPPASR